MKWNEIWIDILLIFIAVVLLILLVAISWSDHNKLESKCFPEHNFGMWIYDDDSAIRMTETEYQQECVK